MSYQAPPPPAGGPPAKFDPKSFNPLDWGIIGAGVLAFLFSFISFYTADVDVSGSCPPGVSESNFDNGGSASAWHEVFGGGFFAWFAMLFAILGAVAVAIGLFAPTVQLPFAARLGGLAAFAAALLFEIIAIFVIPGDSASQSLGSCKIEAGVGHGFGFWVSLIVIAAGAVMSLMRFQATGGKLPGGMDSRVPRVGGYGPQGGVAGGTPPQGGSTPPPAGGTPPPPPGYGPPQ